MKKSSFILVAFFLLCGCSKTQEITEQNLCKDVNPFIGTGGHGHTFPGPILPFGMIQPSPDTRLSGWDGCSGYHYSDSIIHGFSHTHLSGTGVSDYGDILIMPVVDDYLQNSVEVGYEQSYSSKFKKQHEKAHAGYYSVILEKGEIKAELTSGLRTAFHKYTFSKNQEAKIVVDLRHRDKIISAGFKWLNNYKIEGSRISKAWADSQAVHFSAKFSHQIVSISNLSGDVEMNSENIADQQNGIYLINFGVLEEPLQIALAISGVDRQGAAKNLYAESKEFQFDEKIIEGETAWNNQLKKIEIQEEDSDKRKVFYTALYHSFTAPYLFSDVDGRYRGMDGSVYQDTVNQRYTVFSLWDTYRATHPLFTILEQQRTSHLINSLMGQYKEGGTLPIWELGGNYTGCMIGYHAIPVIADAYIKGIKGFDANEALEAMVHSANLSWRGLKSYKDRSYVAVEDEPESLSKTLEYAYDDWCIAQMARKLNDEKIHSFFINRSQYYQNLYDSNTRFFRPKFNGGFVKPFDPYEVNFHLTEANSWQYSMYVPHDLNRLVELHGGVDSLATFLDNIFSAKSETTGRNQADITGLIGQYAHGNEPSHHMAYLYAYTRKNYKTPLILDSIMSTLYSNRPDGLSGNEDCGQMSSWYVFSAMGFYPVCPGSDYYVIGKPQHSSIINLENGNAFFINCINKGNYIKTVKLNGELKENLILLHEEIINGGTLEIEFTNNNYESIFNFKNLLNLSAVSKNDFLPVPIISSNHQTFQDSIEINISSLCDSIYYQLNNSEYRLYVDPIKAFNSAVVKAYSFKNGIKSKSESATYTKRDNNLSVKLYADYADQYSAGGDLAIVDGLRGTENFRTGFWQGYQGQDFEAIINLGSKRNIKNIRIGFLQDARSWIMMPQKIEVFAANNSEQFNKIAESGHNISPKDEENQVKRFSFDLSVTSITKLKIRATYFGRLPSWHLGAGGESWLFIDEIEVN